MKLESYTETIKGTENDLTNPKFFSDKLNVLNDQMQSLLDEFKNAYVYYNMAPSYGEYQNNFLNIKNNIIKTNAQLFMITNNIQKNTKFMNNNLLKLNENIQEEKNTNDKLKVDATLINSSMDSSKQRIDDYTEMYKTKYLTNVNVLIGIIIGLFVCKKVFTVKNKV